MMKVSVALLSDIFGRYREIDQISTAHLQNLPSPLSLIKLMSSFDILCLQHFFSLWMKLPAAERFFGFLLIDAFQHKRDQSVSAAQLRTLTPARRHQ